MTISSVVCAHISRAQTAEALSAQLCAPISWDYGSTGILKNHDNALALASVESDADWCVVIEDDATPIPDFTMQAVFALDTLNVSAASLYFGYLGHPRRKIIQTLDRVDPHWIMKPGFTSAVCIAIKKPFVKPLLETVAGVEHMTVDQRYSYGMKQLGQEWIPHSHPSLVEHSDIPGVDGACGIPRHAYKVGGRPSWLNKQLTFYERVWE